MQDHKFLTHATYSGPGCAICGRPQEEHPEPEKVEGKVVSLSGSSSGKTNSK